MKTEKEIIKLNNVSDLDKLKEGDLVKVTLHNKVPSRVMIYRKNEWGKPYHFITSEDFISNKRKTIVDYGSDLKTIMILNEGIIELSSAHISMDQYNPTDKKFSEYEQFIKKWRKS